MLKKNLPRGIIFLIDLGMVFFSLILAYLLRFNFSIPEVEIKTFRYVFPVLIGFRAISFFLSSTYSGIIRYTSTRDVQRILVTNFAVSGAIALLNLITFQIFGVYAVPYSILIIEFLVTVFGMTTFRLLVKVIYLELMNPNREKTHVVIFGSGESGLITKRTLDRDAGTRYKVLAFLDDDPKKSGKKIEGIPIYNTAKHLESLLEENEIKHLIIAIQSLSPKRKQEIVDTCLKYNVKVMHVPPVMNWINGSLSFKQIKKIRIEDLLEREPIRLDATRIREQLHGKRILITGAAGSIGSEIARQVTQFSPDKVVLLDSAESPLHDLEMEFSDRNLSAIIEPVVADIRNQDRMENVFRHFKPHVVFHAAAYKHVPMMEHNPSEAILTNILGTKCVADLADQFKVEEFVMISTDKAVNPSSIMGATKRIAEIYIQSLNTKSDTRFVTTRFGNVLGSSGSVIPRFNKQIEAREPITITHPDIVRYFMTIPEACQLVLEAAAMGKGGEIFIFDMGSPVRIVDLAKKMIQLNGLELDKDIRIAYTGLRPGEKLYEELLANEENTIPTHHEKIMIAKVKEYAFDEVKAHIEELIALFGAQDNRAIVLKMKQIVPEYISNNSIYEQLDRFPA
jgi:FlaA1/EpsC-like NDP-sugar epimerase